MRKTVPLKVKFGKNLKEYRIKAGHTQESLAEKTGMSATAISSIETGNSFPTYNNLISLLKEKYLNMGHSGLLLDLLHAHRVSHLWLCHSMLNLFAIRICSFCSLHPSANPPNHHYNVSRPTTQNKTPDNICYLVFYMGRSGLEPPTSPLSGVRSNHLS